MTMTDDRVQTGKEVRTNPGTDLLIPAGMDRPLAVMADIDDVLYPWYDTAHEVCTRAGITNGVTPRTWVVHEEYGCTLEEWWGALGVATNDGTLYGAKPIVGAIDALWALERAGATINLVTARATHPLIPEDIRRAIKDQTERWLLDHFVPYDTLTFTERKASVPADYSVDDSIRNYDELEAAGHRPFLVNQPWNQPPEDGRRRVNHIAEAVAKILREDA